MARNADSAQSPPLLEVYSQIRNLRILRKDALYKTVQPVFARRCRIGVQSAERNRVTFSGREAN
jgi:hypothetical protein